MKIMPGKKLQIRNSTAEFLIFTSQAGENTIEVMVQDETVWLTQKMIAALFDSTKQNVGQHLKKIFEEGELQENSVVKNFFTTAADGKQYDMKDWAEKLNAFLQFNEKDILKNAGKVTQAIVKTFAESVPIAIGRKIPYRSGQTF